MLNSRAISYPLTLGMRAPISEGARIGMAEKSGGYIGRDAAAIVISILEK